MEQHVKGSSVPKGSLNIKHTMNQKEQYNMNKGVVGS